ncbi:hypothetical protein [Aquabacterium sp.]|uniref:hypothetical protein n=1 Tax=Aquabacterium sp. TaxID=1872578 RepID=UPI0019BF1F98|nr:hypothetical protein [Aquabacterium sp.]MBC7701718.1 hypothetical protein [Aquabacterium sp.]
MREDDCLFIQSTSSGSSQRGSVAVDFGITQVVDNLGIHAVIHQAIFPDHDLAL